MPNKLPTNSFVRPLSDSPLTTTLDEFVKLAEAHEGLFIIEDKSYDNVLYCGTDNLYFSYCFNATTSRATTETLLIVDSITRVSESTFAIFSQGIETFVLLKE